MSEAKKTVLKGELLDFGVAPYQNNPKNTQSYFVSLSSEEGVTSTKWGVDLQRAIEDSNVQKGDTIILNDLGKQPVSIPDPDAIGQFKTVHKNLWEIEKYEPVLDLPNVIEHDDEREQQKQPIQDKTEAVQDVQTQNQPKAPDLSEFDWQLPSSIKNNYIAITKNRYLTEQKTNYYDKGDKDQVNIAFEDRNKSLHTSRNDDKTINAMLDLAQSKGWTAIKLKGTEEFKQKAWLEASLRGIETKGYTPNEKDKAELQAKQEERTVNQVEMTAQKVPEPRKESELGQSQTQEEKIVKEPFVLDIPAYHTFDNKQQDRAYLDRVGANFAGVVMERTASNFNEVKENAKDFTGRELTNFHSGITAVVSRNALDKMLSEKAYIKSANVNIHRIAVSNADKLFENAVFGWQSDDKNQDRNTNAVHRAIAPLKIDDTIHIAKLTIKEFANEVDGNRFYSIEAVELEDERSPIPEMVADDIKYNARTDRLNGALIDIIVQNAQEYNKQNKKNITQNELKRINNAFNEQLQQLVDEKLHKSHVFQLGKPSQILLNTGFPDKPIELRAEKLWEKSQADWHKFDIASAKDLPKALQEPMAVFAYGDKNKSQNVITSIEHEGKKFVVGVHFSQMKDGIEVNSVRGFFPKDNHEWLNWIAQDKALYLDKEKVQSLITQQQTNLADVSYLDLNLVKSIVKNFENVKPKDIEKSPIPEVTEEYSKGVTPHRLNETLIDIIVQNAQEYNKQNQKNITQNEPQTSVGKKMLIDELSKDNWHLQRVEGIDDQKIARSSYDKTSGYPFDFYVDIGDKVSLYAPNSGDLGNYNKIGDYDLPNNAQDVKTLVETMNTAYLEYADEHNLYSDKSVGERSYDDYDNDPSEMYTEEYEQRIYEDFIDQQIASYEQTVAQEPVKIQAQQIAKDIAVETATVAITPTPLQPVVAGTFIVKDTKEVADFVKGNLGGHQAQKTAEEIKNDIRQIFQAGYKDGSITSRDALVTVLKERGFEIKENDKSIRVSLPNSDQAVNLRGEAFTKGYDAIKALKQRLELDDLKTNYPTLTDDQLVHITAFKNKLFDEQKDSDNPKRLQASLVQLEESVKAMAQGKDLNLPALPVNEIKPDVAVRTLQNHDKSRQV